jgi:hypothetical protein
MLRFVSRGSSGVEPRQGLTDPRAPRSAGRGNLARSDWLILFAAFEDTPEGLDPVRLQQGLFLFSQCPGVPPWSKYAFEPGVYGPSSDELYEDLDRLAGERMIEPVPVRGAHWSLYKPIDATYEQAKRILKQAEADDLTDATRQLAEIKQYVSSAGFGELLDRVSAEHPEFTANSAFRSAA